MPNQVNFQFITGHRQVSSYYRNEIEIAHKNRKRTRTFIDEDGRFCKIAKTTVGQKLVGDSVTAQVQEAMGVGQASPEEVSVAP